MIKVVIKDLEREKEPSIKGDKNLNESILVSKEITKTKSNIFLFFIDASIKSFIVKSRLLCKMLYNVFTISTYQN